MAIPAGIVNAVSNCVREISPSPRLLCATYRRRAELSLRYGRGGGGLRVCVSVGGGVACDRV